MSTPRPTELALLCLALAASLAGPARAGVGAWTPLGPPGGFVRTLAVRPSEPGVISSGTATGGAFFGAYGRGRWRPLPQESDPGTLILLLSFDGAHPGVMYTTSNLTLIRTADDGAPQRSSVPLAFTDTRSNQFEGTR